MQKEKDDDERKEGGRDDVGSSTGGASRITEEKGDEGPSPAKKQRSDSLDSDSLDGGSLEIETVYKPKKQMPSGQFYIEWSMTKNLIERTSYEEDPIDRWYGKLCLDNFDHASGKEITTEVGSIQAYKIEGSWCGYDTCFYDCHSDELVELRQYFNDNEDEFMAIEVGCREEISGCSLFYIKKLLVKPEFRGLGLGLYMIDEGCRKINDSCGLTALCPASLDDTGRPNKQGDEWKLAHQKLKEYYGLIGMKPLGDKYIARSKTQLLPHLGDVCPHLFE